MDSRQPFGWLALAFFQHDMHGMSHEMASEADPFSLFNHHLAGWLVVLVGLLTLLEESRFGQRRWVKCLWPLPLLAVAVFVLLRSDSDITWQFSVWLPDTEAVQHKLFGLLALAIGLIELLRRTGHLTHVVWRYLFYAGLFGGGAFLLFHSGVQHSHIIHQQHIRMGATAIAIALAKVLADVTPRTAWLRMYLVPALFLGLGLQLAFYVE